MIKNIVFDMGKVLLDYECDAAIRAFTKDEKLIKKISMAVFLSQEWVLLDMGIISEEQGLSRMLAHLDTEEEKEIAEKAFKNWHRYNLFPKAGMGELVKELKEKHGYNCYILSNASVRVPECCYDIIPGHEYMSGALFSANEKCIKPQDIIYERFFKKFDLRPEECFFIDDLYENILGAEKTGMKGYCFSDGDIGKLREILCNLRCRY
ncbi:MAG: HAD family phosphatase [Eubacteriales bacterium]|nr:HAD family phosphatase [Eubacteriales bacterium]